MGHENENLKGQLARIKDLLDDHNRILSLLLQYTGTEQKTARGNPKEIRFRDGERLLDNQDLCVMLRLSKRSLQRYRSLGLLPYLMLRQKTYYKESDVMRFLAGHLKDLKKEGTGLATPSFDKSKLTI